MAFFVLLLVTGCDSSGSRLNVREMPKVVNGSLEVVHDGEIFDDTHSIQFSGDGLLDHSRGVSGNHSILLSADRQQAFVLQMREADFRDEYSVSVWAREEGAACKIVMRVGANIHGQAIPTEETRGEWKRYEAKLRVSREVYGQNFIVFCEQVGDGKVWLDDFEFKIERLAQHSEFTPSYTEESIHIVLSDKDYDKLKGERDEAVKVGILYKSENPYVSATINGESAKVRLKGDWSDHLEGPKWSLRVVMDSVAIYGMRKFSLQSPATRNLMNEYVLHLAYNEAGVFCNKMEFIPVDFDSKVLGIYAQEEHFTKDMQERFGYDFGPILKFDEDAKWDIVGHHPELVGQLPLRDAAVIQIYEPQDFQSAEAKPFADRARTLLYAHQHNLLPTDSIFDMEAMAKFMALQEIFGAYHSYLWINQRFVYNQLTDKLVPIAYDNCPEFDGVIAPGFEYLDAYENGRFATVSHYGLFSHPGFTDKFLASLKRFSDVEFLDEFFEQNEEEFEEAAILLRREHADYLFNRAALYDRAEKINERVQSAYPKWPMQISSIPPDLTFSISSQDSIIPLFPGVSLVAYAEHVAIDTVRVDLVNFSPFEVNSYEFRNGSQVFTGHQALPACMSCTTPPYITDTLEFKPLQLIVNGVEFPLNFNRFPGAMLQPREKVDVFENITRPHD
jgi:hypothetical protein